MRRIQLILAPLFIATFMFSCGGESNDTNEDVPANEDSLTVENLIGEIDEVIPVEYDKDRLEVCIDSIWNCEKVKNKNGDWRESSNGELGLSMMQIVGEDRIFLDFGENNDLRFINYWSFIVEPTKNYQISFYDVVADDYIDFGEWCQ